MKRFCKDESLEVRCKKAEDAFWEAPADDDLKEAVEWDRLVNLLWPELKR